MVLLTAFGSDKRGNSMHREAVCYSPSCAPAFFYTCQTQKIVLCNFLSRLSSWISLKKKTLALYNALFLLTYHTKFYYTLSICKGKNRKKYTSSHKSLQYREEEHVNQFQKTCGAKAWRGWEAPRQSFTWSQKEKGIFTLSQVSDNIWWNSSHQMSQVSDTYQ